MVKAVSVCVLNRHVRKLKIKKANLFRSMRNIAIVQATGGGP